MPASESGPKGCSEAMLKVSRQRGMSAQQAQLLLQPPPSFSQVICRDALRTFHGTSSALPCERALTHLGCCSSMAFSHSGFRRSTIHFSPTFPGSQTFQSLVWGSSLSTQTFILKGKAARHEHVVETNADRVQPLSTQKRSLRVEALRHDAVHGVGIDDCEVASGSIHLIVGPMFAGKTTALLQRVEEEARTGRRVALVKSDKDTRYGLSSIVSHDGRQLPCWAVPSLASFRSQIGEEEYAKLDLIGIDEAQFLKDLCSFCQAAADYEGKTLIVAGLDGDFQRNRFGSILDLVPLADSIVKLSSHCELCGKPASFTFRKTDDRNKEVIGGTDIYMPVCRQHYYSGKVAMEATRTVLSSQKFIALQSDKAEKKANLLFDNEF